jgi:hypothetical protein
MNGKLDLLGLCTGFQGIDDGALGSGHRKACDHFDLGVNGRAIGGV